MCGRFGQADDQLEVLTSYFQAGTPSGYTYQPSYNIAPTQMAVVVADQEGQRRLENMRFGYNPPWNDKLLLINARADTVAEKPTFQEAFKHRRVIVPASFYFEWKRDQDSKTPYIIKPIDEPLFGLAGIYQIQKDKSGQDIKAFTVITCDPNQTNQKLHDRMPCILEKSDYDTWLDIDQTEPEVLMKLLKPFPDFGMQAYAVSGLVNSPKNNFPEITKPV